MMNPRELAESYYEAIGRRDIGSVINLFNDNASLYFPGQDEHSGKDAIVTFFKDLFFSQFTKIGYHNLEIVHSAEIIAIKAYASGTVSTAKSFDKVRYFEFLKLKEDRISRSEICIDMPTLRAQVGKW